MSSIKVFTDGASKGNPGRAGIGVIIYDENDFILDSYKEYLGTATNNQAEYKALIKSAELINRLIEKKETEFDKVEFYSDSDLMVNQVNFDYQVKEPELALLNNKFHVKMKKLAIPFSIAHIDREKNKAADRLLDQSISSV